MRGSKRPRPTLVPPDHRRAEGPSTGSGGSGSFFRACILLLLREQPGHGYDLLERLTIFGFEFRGLRLALSDAARVRARGAGRVHMVDLRQRSATPRVRAHPRGAAQLDVWADSIRDGHRAIERFLGRHAGHKAGGGNDSG